MNGTIMDEIIYSNDFRNVIFIYRVLFTCSNAPTFIKEIGGNESQVGLMMGMFTIAAVVIRPIIEGCWINMVEDPLLFSGSSFWVNDVLL